MSSSKKNLGRKEHSKLSLAPKVRFPEFRHDAAWEEKNLGPFLIDCSGRVPSDTKLPIYSSTRDGLKRQDAYFDGRVLQNDGEYGVVPPDCFVYRHMSDDGLFRFNINDTGGDIAVSKEYPVFKTRNLNSRFLLEKLNEDPTFKKFALSQKAGGTRTRLYFSRLCEWQTLLPLLPEQQKVAECLSSVNDLIAAQARKVDALKTHKKGLMQQLFPREGETQPRLRFPEFQNDEDWVDQSVGDFGQVVTGSTPSTTQSKFYGGGIPFVSPADISDLRFIDQTKTTLTKEGFEETRPIRAGSALFVCIGSTIGKVAQSLRDCATNQQINAVVPSSKHSDGFVYFALSNASDRIALLAGKQAVPIINKSLFSSVRLLVPRLPEQNRIASILSSVDALITAETQKLEALKCHKRGLMQLLFPAVGEVDG